jgi:hypothetical protein
MAASSRDVSKMKGPCLSYFFGRDGSQRLYKNRKHRHPIMPAVQQILR